MAYITDDDLELAAGGAARLVEIADIDADGVADPAVLAGAIAAACGWIDGYLRVRFATPIASPTDTVKAQIADEAIFWIIKRRRMTTEQDVLDKTARDLWARSIADGKLRPDEPNPAPSTAIRSAFRTSSRAVSRETLKGFA
jgi:phage gp36-like protein